MKSPYDVIKRPVLTEKSYDAMGDNKYTFEVAIDANKIEIKTAIEAIFGVKVESVNTMRTMGKMKRQGRFEGRTAEKKKAIVKLTKDSKKIEFFEGMAQ
ncbi:MAG: 50S ribosomal protein L23 [Clostridia bacterium]|nr:50S ribosomal protein L23 [Clostridia bacterium]